MYVKFIGDLYLKMLQCISMPLVIPSLIEAVGSLSISLSGRIGLRAFVYCITTTLIAVVIGLLLVNMCVRSSAVRISLCVVRPLLNNMSHSWYELIHAEKELQQDKHIRAKLS